MAFTPRIHENGRICCSNPDGLCPKCIAHFARQNLGLRDASATNPYATLDPYERDIERLRRELPTPTPLPAPKPGDYTPPDPYREAIAAHIKKEQEQGR